MSAFNANPNVGAYTKQDRDIVDLGIVKHKLVRLQTYSRMIPWSKWNSNSFTFSFACTGCMCVCVCECIGRVLRKICSEANFRQKFNSNTRCKQKLRLRMSWSKSQMSTLFMARHWYAKSTLYTVVFSSATNFEFNFSSSVSICRKSHRRKSLNCIFNCISTEFSTECQTALWLNFCWQQLPFEYTTRTVTSLAVHFKTRWIRYR